jgi:hypothetical protein
MREYRKSHVDKQPTKSNAGYMHEYRKRKAQKKTPQASMSTHPTPTPIIYNSNQANEYLQKHFTGNPSGYACNICDRLWFMNDLKQIRQKNISVLAPEFPHMDVVQFKACVTCTATLDRVQLPSLSSSSGFTHPPYPTHLPPLGCISKRPVAPRLPFMQIRRLRHQMGGYGMVEQVINVPDVNNMVTTLPWQLDDDSDYAAVVISLLLGSDQFVEHKDHLYGNRHKILCPHSWFNSSILNLPNYVLVYYD